jgi:SnoaL-like domain
MHDVTTVIDTYLSAWNEPDPDRRSKLIELAWDADGRLVDPPFAAEGHTGISEMAATMQEHYPGHAFRRASGIDAHHDQVRFAWELVGPDGAVALAGLDVGELAEDGRLRRIAGFFGEVPALVAAD